MDDKRVSLKDIAKGINSPEAFTAKILQQLVKSKIIESLRGPVGGFQIKKERIDRIKLSEIISAIDGDNIYKGCGLGLQNCDANQPCPVHKKFVVVRNELKKMLENTSLYELATGIEVGCTFLTG